LDAIFKFSIVEPSFRFLGSSLPSLRSLIFYFSAFFFFFYKSSFESGLGLGGSVAFLRVPFWFMSESSLKPPMSF